MADDIVDALQQAAGIVEALKKLRDLVHTQRPYLPFEPPDQSGVLIEPSIPPAYLNLRPPLSFIQPPGPESSGPFGQTGGGSFVADNGGYVPKGMLGGSFGENFSEILEGIDQTREHYQEMIGGIVEGNREAAGSITGMFGKLVTGSEEACALTGESFEMMGNRIFDLMGEYAARLGKLSILSSKVFTALRSMNPWVAAAAGVALMVLGKRMRGLAGSVGTGSTEGGSAGTAVSGGGTATGREADGPKMPRTQIIIIDSGGRRIAGSSDLDRTLDRAGIDRSLRNQIREMVRSGSLSFTD